MPALSHPNYGVMGSDRNRIGEGTLVEGFSFHFLVETKNNHTVTANYDAEVIEHSGNTLKYNTHFRNMWTKERANELMQKC